MNAFLAVVASAALLLSGGIGSADVPADQVEILKVEKEAGTALLAADPKALGEFFAGDWRLIASDGSMLDREQLLKALTGGQLKFTAYEQTDLEVRVYGDAAVVVGSGKSQGEWKGESFGGKERFTDVLVRQGGKWRCVSTHTSTLE